MLKVFILSMFFMLNIYANSTDIEFISTTTEPDLRESFVNMLSNKINVKEDIQNWGKNPFFKHQPLPDIDVEAEKKKLEAAKSIHNFQYRFMAIWQHNDAFKVMISGHILSKNDTFHHLHIIDITNDSVTVKKGGMIHTFQLGQSVYDHEI